MDHPGKRVRWVREQLSTLLGTRVTQELLWPSLGVEVVSTYKRYEAGGSTLSQGVVESWIKPLRAFLEERGGVDREIASQLADFVRVGGCPPSAKNWRSRASGSLASTEAMEQPARCKEEPLSYTDEEYAEIKAKKLWGKIDPRRLAGRGTVVLLERDGPMTVPEPLAYLPDDIPDAIRTGRRVVCRSRRRVFVEGAQIEGGQLFTLDLEDWSELSLSDGSFGDCVERIKKPTLAQIREAEKLHIVSGTEPRSVTVTLAGEP